VNPFCIGSSCCLHRQKGLKMSVTELLTRTPWPLDTENQGDGLELLRVTPDEYSPLVILDPQYTLDQDYLKYGNPGSRQPERFQLHQQTHDEIKAMGREIVRILKPSGYCAVWCNQYILVERFVPTFFDDKLKPVDLIVWDKRVMGFGHRSRRQAEFLVMMQKEPIKSLWARSPSIPDVWSREKQAHKSKRTHIHQKPHELQKALIQALTQPGDVIIDPTAGSFSVMHAALDAGRHFLGCDWGGAPAKPYVKFDLAPEEPESDVPLAPESADEF